ncbi:uncharacterized protein METZ01_LOCUS417682 [marine metagenome]|uniref:Uncharacterized protein n=1 Tax=marine metagenome TaxID=408172 RepID=A0A382X371_9ZZZZ
MPQEAVPVVVPAGTSEGVIPDRLPTGSRFDGRDRSAG